MTTLRILCVDTDCGQAIHIGGPVFTAHKTFDIPCPPDLAAWLKAAQQTHGFRAIQGVEVRTNEPTP
jgi:hypothetical protein